jgi:hypothetical protein
MDQAKYQRWWPPHLRMARAELLSNEEQALYETGLRELESEQFLIENTASTEAALAALSSLQRESASLHARRAQLDSEINTFVMRCWKRLWFSCAGGRIFRKAKKAAFLT